MSETMEQALAVAIAEAGGVLAMARAFGLSRPAVAQWKRAPGLRVIDIEKLTGVSRHRLRPDLYPIEDKRKHA